MKKLIILVFVIFFINPVNGYYESFANVLGVDNHGKGTVGNVTVEVQPGKGRILIDTKPFQGVYTQDSERVAVKVASDVTGFNFSKYDVIYSIVTDAYVVDGPSAGGILTLATIAAVEGKNTSKNFAMTGTIQEDGTIGQVSEIFAKAKAAADAGVTLLLIPKGQRYQNQYVKKVRIPQPGWYIETIEPVSVDIVEYAKENWDMSVYEVSNIKEAMKYAFGKIPEKTIESKIIEIDNTTIPTFNSPLSSYNEFSDMVSDEIKVAEEKLNRVSRKLYSSSLPEDIKLDLNEMLKSSEEYINNGKEIQKRGYAYSAANEGFKSIITTDVVEDLINYYTYGPSYIRTRIDEVKKNINETNELVILKTEKMICNPEKFEWAVASQERLTYAENRINSLDTKMNPVEIFYGINTAEEWLVISKTFLKTNNNFPYNKDCVLKFKEMAESSIREAENQILIVRSTGYDTTEEEWYLNAAKSEFEKGWYITAIYDSATAKVKSKIGSKFENKNIGEIYSSFNKTEVVPESLISAIFFEHSHYNMYHGIKENSKEESILAIQLMSLSDETNRIYRDVKDKIGKNSLDWSFKWEVKIDENVYITILWVLLLVLVLSVFVLWYRIKKIERKFGFYKSRKKELE
ncbi:MAG: S16 family serine protease [Candidatus Aenigmatarchaeota archaeon]